MTTKKHDTVEIVTAVADREAIAFATMMAEKQGLEGPTCFLNWLINEAMREAMKGENWSSSMTDAYCPRQEGPDLDDGIPF